MQHVALVTGAGRGIGAAVAERLGAAGARVLLAARTLAECEVVAARIRERGGAASALALDVTDPGSVAAAADVAREAGVDWLVNNAGLAISAPLLAEDNDALFARHLDVNLHGPRRLVEALAPSMLDRGYGRVVNVASSAALRGYAYVAAYAASKHALLGYTRSAALELGRTGVTFHAVCPHYVDSPMTDASIERVVERTGRTREEAAAFFASQNPGGRLVRPEEVADAVLALCEGDTNGEIVELDGSER